MEQYEIEAIWLSPAEVARRTGKSIQTLANDRHLGRGFPYSKTGRSVRYFWPHVHADLISRTIKPESN